MTKYHAFLIRFMREKQKAIEKLIAVSPDFYFNDFDALSILSWGKSEARYISKEIIEHILLDNQHGLHSTLCPFCMKYLNFNGEFFEYDCDSCSYGKKHGFCTTFLNNTWGFLFLNIENLHKKLDNDFYREIIKRLNKDLNIYKIRKKNHGNGKEN